MITFHGGGTRGTHAHAPAHARPRPLTRTRASPRPPTAPHTHTPPPAAPHMHTCQPVPAHSPSHAHAPAHSPSHAHTPARDPSHAHTPARARPRPLTCTRASPCLPRLQNRPWELSGSPASPAVTPKRYQRWTWSRRLCSHLGEPRGHCSPRHRFKDHRPSTTEPTPGRTETRVQRARGGSGVMVSRINPRWHALQASWP